MIPLTHLWLPVLLSAVAVFVVSSLIHMVFHWHNPDYRGLANEEAVRRVLGDVAPGQYILPHCPDPRTEEAQARYQSGPIGLLWVQKAGVPDMGKALGGWFLFNLILAFCVAYVGSRTVGTGAPFLQVLRITGKVAFLAHAAGTWPNVIWMGKPCKVALKETLDGLLYALALGALFGWLWPR